MRDGRFNETSDVRRQTAERGGRLAHPGWFDTIKNKLARYTVDDVLICTSLQHHCGLIIIEAATVYDMIMQSTTVCTTLCSDDPVQTPITSITSACIHVPVGSYYSCIVSVLR